MTEHWYYQRLNSLYRNCSERAKNYPEGVTLKYSERFISREEMDRALNRAKLALEQDSLDEAWDAWMELAEVFCTWMD